MALALPPANFSALPLLTRKVKANNLYRVSRASTNEPHFGTSSASRFNAPIGMTTDRFGVCYMGLSLDVAFAESVLHDLTADALGFNIPQSEVNSRFLVRFDGEPLVLANFTGASLLRHGADGQISTTLDYSITQAWSAAVHAHPQNVDGILYVSRHLNTGKAIAFYNRAGGKLRQGTTISLSQGLGLGAVLGRFGVQLA